MTKVLGGCVECPAGSRRPTTRPGPRCTTHQRARKLRLRETAWAAHLRKTYGISPEEYWAIYEAQGGVCYLCRRATGKAKRLSVDHDHKLTGWQSVRGLLCSPCNRGVLGHLRDDPAAFRRGETYLLSPPAREVLTRLRGLA